MRARRGATCCAAQATPASAQLWQHAGRLPEQHELDPVLEYFLPLYRSAILNVEIIIRSYLIDQGEVEPYEDDEELISEAGSDVTRATESSESICDETDDTPAQ